MTISAEKKRVYDRGRRGKRERRGKAKIDREERLRAQPFIGWDGEGYDDEHGNHHYMLFGCSEGDKVYGESLSTVECLDLILDVERSNPDGIHVGFAFEYDVNMILRDLEWRYLAVLYDTGQVTWRGYKISHTPHKIFRVSRDKVTATIYDVFGFFHSTYVSALKKYGVGDAETIARIEQGKAARGSFRMEEMETIVAYWKAELQLMPDLMEHIRRAAFSGGFYITEWHGPGALAAYALRTQGMNKFHFKDLKPDVKLAIQSAYAGGRFQPFYCGPYDGPVHTADINSAYIYACSMLPRGDNGKWRRKNPAHVRGPGDVDDFALYRIEFDSRDSFRLREYVREGKPLPPMPFFHRSKNGILTWPQRVIGWYWAPEVKAALEVLPECVKVREALVYEHDNSRPFRWVFDSYARRLQLQHEGNPAEKAYKWALAAMYGAFARRVGWNKKTRKAPASHELAWAGWITSYCRAMVFRASFEIGVRGRLVSIDTDGITSLERFTELENGIGDELGQWKLDEYDGIMHWQSGVYWLHSIEQCKWVGAKTRGIKKGSLSYESARMAYDSADFNNRPPRHPYIQVVGIRFIGYRMALRGRFKEWRRWKEQPMKVIMGGQGKGAHVVPFCGKCRGKEGVPMHTISVLAPMEVLSEKHKLPWLEPPPEMPASVIDGGEWIWGEDAE